MKRILIDQGGIAISAPGYNVTAATGVRQFLFNSAQAAPFGVFMSGVVGFGSFSLYSSQANGAQTTNKYRYQVYFGTTLPNPPVAFLAFENAQFGGASPHYLLDNVIVIINNGNATSSGGACYAGVTIYTDHIDIFVIFITSTAQAAPPSAISFVIGHN
jgi:hypothetical protein